jgi:hypothetical protein
MVDYVSQAMKQASHEATVLLFSSGIDPFLEDLAKGADRVFYFEEGPRDTPRLTAKTWLKMKSKLHIHRCKKCPLATQLYIDEPELLTKEE